MHCALASKKNGVCTVHSAECTILVAVQSGRLAPYSVQYTVTLPGLVTSDLPSSRDSWSDGDLRRTHGPITDIEVKVDSDGDIYQMRAR